MVPRLFTSDEAERLLPELTEWILEMRARKREHERHHAVVSELERKMGGNGHVVAGPLQEARKGMAEALSEVNRLAQEAESLGCELKDIDEGLIDFRAMVDGEEAYLCWKLGEPKIDWWHSLQTGFAGRQPLMEQR